MLCLKNSSQLIVKEMGHVNECSECSYDDRPFGNNRVNREPCTCTSYVTDEFFCEEHQSFVKKCRDCGDYFHHSDYFKNNDIQCSECYRKIDPSTDLKIYEWDRKAWCHIFTKKNCNMCNVDYYVGIHIQRWRRDFECPKCLIRTSEFGEYELKLNEKMDDGEEDHNYLIIIQGIQIFIEGDLVQESEEVKFYPYLRRKCCCCRITWSKWRPCLELFDYRCINCDPSTELVRYKYKEYNEGWNIENEGFKCKVCNKICWFVDRYITHKHPQIQRCRECKPTNPDLKFEAYNSGWKVKQKKTTNGNRHYWTSAGCYLLDEFYKCECKKCEKYT